MLIGFAGLGRMGNPMVRHLLAAGHSVLAYDPGAAEIPVGATRVTDPSVLATADVSISMLPDGATTRRLIEDELHGADTEHLHLIMGTVGATLVRDLASSSQLRIADAPVSGSVTMAEAATITTMVGATEEQFDRVRPMLAAMTAQQFHVGLAGSGSAAKLAVNTVLSGLSQAVAEGLLVAEAGDLDLTAFYDVLKTSAAGAPYVGYKQDAFLAPGDTPVAATLGLIRKDLGLALELSRSRGMCLPGSEAAYGVLEEGIASGLQDADMAQVLTVLRRRTTPVPTTVPAAGKISEERKSHDSQHA